MANFIENELRILLEENYPQKEVNKILEDQKSSADPVGLAEEIFAFSKKHGSKISPII